MKNTINQLDTNQMNTLRQIANGRGAYRTPPAAVISLRQLGLVESVKGIGASTFRVTAAGSQALKERGWK